MRQRDLFLTVRQRKLPCVLDPALVLCSPHGPALALRLTQVMEPWLTRSFWQVIDASDLVFAPDESRASSPPTAAPPLQPAAAALAGWIDLRRTTDAGSWPFRWVGDNLAESQVQDSADADIVDRYEALVEGLLQRLQRDAVSTLPVRSWPLWWDPVECCFDALALSATLDAAVVLSCAAPGDGLPWPAQALQRAGVPSQRLDPLPAESLFASERALVRDALAAAGLATLVQQLPPLVIAHVQACADRSAGARPGLAAVDADQTLDAPYRGDDAVDLWCEARAWWYSVGR